MKIFRQTFYSLLVATVMFSCTSNDDSSDSDDDQQTGCIEYVDQEAQGNFKGTDFTVQGGTYRALGPNFFCQIYVLEQTGGDCAFPTFDSQFTILFTLDELELQTITLSDIAGEGETLNFNSVSNNQTDVELATCGSIEITEINASTNTISGKIAAEGQQGSTISGNFTLELCDL